LLLRSRGERPCAAHANSDNEFASFHVPPQRAETAAMKLRRGRSNQEIATGGTGFKADLARQQLRGLYVSLGSTATSRDVYVTSALPLKADIRQRNCDVRFGPGADDWCGKGSSFRGRDTRIYAGMFGPTIRR
jgi:hypothetical protein